MTQEGSNPLAGRFLQTMVVTSCLSAVAGSAAMATTVTEGQGGAPSDFPNSFSGYALPLGTTTVLGSLSSRSDTDWFEFQGLTGTYDIHAFFSPLGQEAGVMFALFNSAATQLASGTLEGSGRFLTGAAPSDGNLAVELFSTFGGSEGGTAASSLATYEVDSLSGNPTVTTTVPEPASLALLAVPMAGALAWRRRRRG